MTRRRLAQSGVVIAAALAAGCGKDSFPVTPTPVATSPVVLQGTKYQGNIAAGERRHDLLQHDVDRARALGRRRASRPGRRTLRP